MSNNKSIAVRNVVSDGERYGVVFVPKNERRLKKLIAVTPIATNVNSESAGVVLRCRWRPRRSFDLVGFIGACRVDSRKKCHGHLLVGMKFNSYAGPTGVLVFVRV
jgi:hypothetical protein